MALKLVRLPVERVMMKKGKGAGNTLPLDYNQSVSVTEEEKLFLDVLAMYVGMRPATFARRLMYIGLAAFLGDRSLPLPKPELVIQQELVRLVDTDPALREIKDIVQAQKRQPSRAARKAKHG